MRVSVVVLGVGVVLMSLFLLPLPALKLLGAVTGLLVSVFPLAEKVWLRPADLQLADKLAEAVQTQWITEAGKRHLVQPAPIPVSWSLSDLPVAGPLVAAVGDPEAPPFRPLPGHTRVTERQLRTGGGRHELFAVYAGIASGRVVVVGAPGAGKSASAILLLLDALKHRKNVEDIVRPQVPVPVLFTAHGWDPKNCSVQDWLADRLTTEYKPLHHRRAAAALVTKGAVALILDGLDEMDEAQRQYALQELNGAHFRIVVLTRSQEMMQAARDYFLVGAVAIHLRDITGPEGADYLYRSPKRNEQPDGWTQLLAQLRENPDSVLARGLSTPLALTLVRDTYGPDDDVRDLFDATRWSTADDIKRYLNTRVIHAAYPRGSQELI